MPLKDTFRPEFLNRVDEIVVFKALSQEELMQIVDLMLADTKKALNEKDINLEIDELAKKIFVGEWY